MTLDSLASQCRKILAIENNPVGRAKVAALIGNALRDPAFIGALFAGDAPERKVVYEDPALGFCIVAHNYRTGKVSGPHDHGPSWAIYGQAEGETNMSDFELVSPPAGGEPGKVRKVRSYALRPGDVHLYNEGDLHAPSRTGPTRLVRVEGVNMDKVTRDKYELVA